MRCGLAQLSDEELTATIAMLDENQDGQVSMEEFVRMGKISTNLDDTRAQLQESQSELSAAQVGMVQSALQERNASCSFNMTIDAVLGM